MSQISPAGTAVVTGASSGIGALYAQGLAERGHDLVLVARRQDRLDAVAARIRAKTGVKVEVVVADLSKPADLARVEARLSRDAAITVLVNNAGVANYGAFETASDQSLDETIAVNVTALTRLTRAVLPGLVRHGAGVIVNVASVLAFHPLAALGVYAAAKAYVVAFSQALQAEVAGKGVLVQVLAPPAVATDFWDSAGLAVSNLPEAAVMTLQDLAAAALKGFDREEQFVIPSLPEVADWESFQAARQKLVGVLMNGKPAARYAA
ncbi:SDR family oxidoreductase [Oleomonas cavernae]|uniref:SDR family oxidoreductase n=1 Tax=Oleomonas cavernae TaxID=2320859 RepID=A0A418WCN8_9PROT|nr:SDR family oxidoreductase [Oleomonas cavernae]RJF87754.1 SDR family oxidoreductase [Oleomonas cavernae]